MLLDDLSIVKKLGNSSFGDLFLTLKQGYIEISVTNQINKKAINIKNCKKYINREIAILKGINHENIVKLYEIKETSEYLYIVREYCNGGNLDKCLQKYQESYNSPFPEELVQYFMRQIISAVKYLHDKRIINRDIKLNNILVHYNSEEDKKRKIY